MVASVLLVVFAEWLRRLGQPADRPQSS